MSPLAGKYWDEASRTLRSMGSAEHGHIQTKLKRSVIITLGDCLAFVGF